MMAAIASWSMTSSAMSLGARAAGAVALPRKLGKPTTWCRARHPGGVLRTPMDSAMPEKKPVVAKMSAKRRSWGQPRRGASERATRPFGTSENLRPSDGASSPENCDTEAQCGRWWRT